ncbi:MAG: hypothetical protein HRU33_20960 [Rhodobacteraceae bacterium]|nr:hypothetical protein [Paracoccaceae bacterium]
MQNPFPVNLMTPAESRSLGWAAESRDADHHLVTQHASFENDAELTSYIREETQRGMTVTVWPPKVKKQEMDDAQPK